MLPVNCRYINLSYDLLQHTVVKHGLWQVTEQNRLLIFEVKVFRKIYGPTQDNDGTWKIKTNEELEILIKKGIIVRFIKSQRLRWAAHVIRMDTIRTVKKQTEWEPCSSRSVGRPRLRWLEQIEEDLKKIKVRNLREKCKDCGTK